MPEVILMFRAHVAYQAHVGFVNFGLSFKVERLLGRERHLRAALWCFDEHRGYDVPSVSPPKCGAIQGGAFKACTSVPSSSNSPHA